MKKLIIKSLVSILYKLDKNIFNKETIVNINTNEDLRLYYCSYGDKTNTSCKDLEMRQTSIGNFSRINCNNLTLKNCSFGGRSIISVKGELINLESDSQ